MVSSCFSSRSSFDHAGGFLDAHAGHRLVEQQHARPGGERHRDFELAVFAMTHVGDRRVGPRAKPDAPERRAGGFAQFRLLARVAPEVERMSGVRLYGERDIVERGEIEEQRGDLERAREPAQAALPGGQRRDVLSGEADAAGLRGKLTGQLPDQRGLAGAVRPDDRVQLSLRDRERDIVRRDHAAEAFGEPFDLKQRLSHGAAGAGRRCRRVRTARSAAAADRG